MHLQPPRHPSTQWNEVQGAETLATWRKLLPLGPPQRYAERNKVFTQGDTPRDVFFLARGIVKLTCDLPDGQESVFALRYVGHMLEECAYELKVPYPISATTIVPCEIHRLEVNRMIEAERNNPEVIAFERHVLKRDLYNTAAALVELKALRSEEIVARALGELALAQGAKSNGEPLRFTLPLHNLEMAEWLGMSESHFKQTCVALEAKGRLQRIGRIFILRQTTSLK